MTGQTDQLPKIYIHQYVSLPLPTFGGNRALQPVFYETWKESITCPRPLYTLKTRDYTIPPESQHYLSSGPNLLRSIYLLYLDCSDPAEFNFAQLALADWEHWDLIRKSAFFKPYYAQMREALKAKIESETFQIARSLILTDKNSQSLQALKWLNDQVKGPSKGRGRPSKDEIEGELKRQAADARDLSEDLERLGMK